MKIVLFLVLAILLVGCGSGGGGGLGGGGGPGEEYCVGSFEGGSTSFACNGCTLDPFQDQFGPTIDNDSGTYRDFTLAAGDAQMTVKAYAPNGMSFPAGVDAGALMRFPTGSFPSISIRFNTFNGATPVDQQAGGDTAVAGNVTGAGSDTYYTLTPAMEFDRLEAVITVSGHTDPVQFRLYEICGDR